MVKNKCFCPLRYLFSPYSILYCILEIGDGTMKKAKYVTYSLVIRKLIPKFNTCNVLYKPVGASLWDLTAKFPSPFKGYYLKYY